MLHRKVAPTQIRFISAGDWERASDRFDWRMQNGRMIASAEQIVSGTIKLIPRRETVAGRKNLMSSEPRHISESETAGGRRRKPTLKPSRSDATPFNKIMPNKNYKTLR